MTAYRAIRGMKDILPDEIGLWQKIEADARRLFRTYGYSEIRTPIMEETALFTKSVGEETDIVKKEMFSFQDRGERHISLRPEGTAPVIRAYLEHNLPKTRVFQKLYYLGPMFRAERPQAGRLRQFHQTGVEAIGSSSPALDAEVIMLLARLLDLIGVTGYEMRLNNLGCAADKKSLSGHLKASLASPSTNALLCEDCKRRATTNPLRVLDCKNEHCRTVVRGCVKEASFLCADCAAHFERVRLALDAWKIPYVVDPYIVRGLDYYTRTVFEAVHTGLGAQNAIGAGGRYDRLVSDMGGPELGACGFAIGIDRAILARGDTATAAARQAGVDLYIATLGEAAAERAYLLAATLRDAGIGCDVDFEGRSLKAQMRSADSLGVRYVLIIGDDELAKGEAVVRNMATKEQIGVRFEDMIAKMRELIGK